MLLTFASAIFENQILNSMPSEVVPPDFFLDGEKKRKIATSRSVSLPVSHLNSHCRPGKYFLVPFLI